MQQFTTYGAKIHMESAKPIQAMVRIYRDVVSYLIRVCIIDFLLDENSLDR